MIKTFVEDAEFYDITISGITVNGKAVLQEDTFIEVTNTINFKF